MNKRFIILCATCVFQLPTSHGAEVAPTASFNPPPTADHESSASADDIATINRTIVTFQQSGRAHEQAIEAVNVGVRDLIEADAHCKPIGPEVADSKTMAAIFHRYCVSRRSAVASTLQNATQQLENNAPQVEKHLKLAPKLEALRDALILVKQAERTAQLGAQATEGSTAALEKSKNALDR